MRFATARIRTTIFLTGDFIRRYPARHAPRRGGRTRGGQPHGYTSAPDHVRRERAAGDTKRRRPRLPRSESSHARRRTTTGRRGARWRRSGERHSASRTRRSGDGRPSRVTGTWAGREGAPVWTDSTGSRIPARSRTGPPIAWSLRWSSSAENGGIVLLHLGSDRADPVASRIPSPLRRPRRPRVSFRARFGVPRTRGTDRERLAALSGAAEAALTP